MTGIAVSESGLIKLGAILESVPTGKQKSFESSSLRTI